MTARKSRVSRDWRVGFEALSIEGGLLSPDWLAKVAQLQAGLQTGADYAVPKGLHLRDEIGRYWRIAQAHWSDFSSAMTAQGDTAGLAVEFVTALLREVMGFTMLHAVDPVSIGERAYPIGFAALGGRVPVVVARAGEGLDIASSAYGDGARRRSPFGLAQEFLNAQEDSLWGVVSDGFILRVLRDNASLTRPAWIEADLQRIFTEERYAEFAALWLLAHETRFGREGQPTADCALETWRNAGREEGTRARDHLRRGVEDALIALGGGFLAHPANHTLRTALETGGLTTREYQGELLRLVYRMIFLLTVEERGLLHPERTTDAARTLYAQGYGFRHLRERALRRSAHDRFADLWEATKVVFRGLATGEPRLGLPAFGGIFATNRCKYLDSSKLDNRTFLQAIFKLAWLRDDGSLVRVNWRDMGPEELGSVYESLLELVPQITQNGRQFEFATGAETKGNARKTTGSYYTPDSLVQALLDSALEPVVSDTIARNHDDPANALLRLSIVDPACGSGHFLLAAARRVAAHVARLQATGTPSAAEYRRALRQVVARCIYGVDLNPMAVELCKVALWMEAVEPGLPLTFLDSHIQHGNALLGSTPDLIAKGIPISAWEPLEGDNKKVAQELRKRHKLEAGGQIPMDIVSSERTGAEAKSVTQAIAALDTAADDTVSDVEKKEFLWETILGSSEYQHQRLVADTWCAAFVWPKVPGSLADVAPTYEHWLRILTGSGTAPKLTTDTVRELGEEYAFFHWHLQFPQVFSKGGFDVVLGNPPWERVKLQEQEFFAMRDPEIATAPTSATRKKLIEKLVKSDGPLLAEFLRARRNSEGQSHILRKSGRYSLTGVGDINTYAVFAELDRTLVGGHGRVGVILPTGIATDATTAPYFRDLVEQGSLVSLFDFENSKPLFEGVHRSFKFCLLTLTGLDQRIDSARFAFFANDPAALADRDVQFTLTPDEIKLLNPNTGTCPVFRSRRDAEITLGIYKRIPVLINESDAENGNPWGIRFMTMFHMSNDSHLFHTREELEADGWTLVGNVFEREVYPPPPENTPNLTIEHMLPLYEAKMIHHYDTKWATYERDGSVRNLTAEEKRDREFYVMPRYWVHENEVARKLEGKWDKHWMLGWRDICRSTDVRTVIAAQVPYMGYGDKWLLALPSQGRQELQAVWSSFVFDYAARQKIGGTSLKFFTFMQLPVPSPVQLGPWVQWIAERVDRLNDQSLDANACAFLRAELDALMFYIYGISRNDTAYLMDSFAIVKRKDEERYGQYRSKGLILAMYDAKCWEQ